MRQSGLKGPSPPVKRQTYLMYNIFRKDRFSVRNAKKLIITILIITVIFSVPAISALADGALAYGAATVDTEGLRLRTGPSTSHKVLAYLSEGDIVVILECTNSEWYNVNFHGTVGYVSVPLLRDVLTAENFNARGRLTGDKVNLRAKPNTSSDILGTYTQGTEMTVIGINSGWYKVRHDDLTGYVRSDYMDIVGGYKASSASSTKSSAPAANRTLGQKIVDYALSYVGSKYVYGGASPSGFDCSGFVTYVYKNFGISVTRTASGQYRDNGVHVNRSELALGDLVFFSNNGGKGVTHVGIYIGDDEFVHASRPGIGVVISRLDSSYYTTGWYGAKRLISK